MWTNSGGECGGGDTCGPTVVESVGVGTRVDQQWWRVWGWGHVWTNSGGECGGGDTCGPTVVESVGGTGHMWTNSGGECGGGDMANGRLDYFILTTQA